MSTKKFGYGLFKTIIDSNGVLRYEDEVVAEVVTCRYFSIIHIFDMLGLAKLTDPMTSSMKKEYVEDERAVRNKMSKRFAKIGAFSVREFYIGELFITSYMIPFFTPLCDWSNLAKMTERKIIEAAKPLKDLYHCRRDTYIDASLYDCVLWGDF